jgi:N-acetylglucosamine-6-sulfatase
MDPSLTPLSYNGKWLPSWLQEAGYQTYYTGKLMNGNNVMNALTRPTQGFNGMSNNSSPTRSLTKSVGSDIFLDPYTYSYINTSISHNGGAPIKNTTYSTDLVRDIGLGYIDTALQSDQPFFIGCAYLGLRLS